MRLLVWLASAALLTAACSAATPVVSAPGTGASATPGSAPAVSPRSVTASPSTGQLAPYLTMTLTDARSGEKFTLGDYKGKVTIVEGMAVW